MRSNAVVLLFLLLAACQTKSIGQVSDIEACRVGASCTVSGTLAVREVDHVKMGALQMSDGECLPVSLSAAKIDQFVASGPVATTLTGSLERSAAFDPLSPIVSLEMKGRRIGIQLCNSVFLFVDDDFSEGLKKFETE